MCIVGATFLDGNCSLIRGTSHIFCLCFRLTATFSAVCFEDVTKNVIAVSLFLAASPSTHSLFVQLLRYGAVSLKALLWQARQSLTNHHLTTLTSRYSSFECTQKPQTNSNLIKSPKHCNHTLLLLDTVTPSFSVRVRCIVRVFENRLHVDVLMHYTLFS